MPPRLILGIESSCDETSAAVVAEGRTVLSNVVASQLVHVDYGGVVPELASREHLRAIVPVVREAMRSAGLPPGPEGYRQLSAVAVTEGPGLAGALLVGITFAKALAFGADLPLIAVNHLEGHIQAVLLEAEQRFAEASPLLAAVVSGGHSHLYLATGAPASQIVSEAAPEAVSEAAPQASPAPALWTYRNIGRTVDDAAGEAFDKVAKLLGLPYPGGPWIDALAPHGNPAAVPFIFHPLKPRPNPAHDPGHATPAPSWGNPGAGSPLGVIPEGDSYRPAANVHAPAIATARGGLAATRSTPSGAPTQAGSGEPRFDVSFSGIKTAVRRYTEVHNLRPAISARDARMRSAGFHLAKPNNPDALQQMLALLDNQTLDLVASFQAAVNAHLTRTILRAASHFGARAVAVSGGVAANRDLRARLQLAATAAGLPLAFPSLALSTDNAAMIAAAAWPKFLHGRFADDTLEATPSLRLG